MRASGGTAKTGGLSTVCPTSGLTPSKGSDKEERSAKRSGDGSGDEDEDDGGEGVCVGRISLES